MSDGKFYGIHRIERRSKGAIYGCQIEANRSLSDHNKGREFFKSQIDWDMTENNIHVVESDNWMKDIYKKFKSYGVAPRKNSVFLLDAIYTASPEWWKVASMEEQCNFLKDCYKFHVKEYCHGDPNLVLNFVIHFDETTPHIHLCSVPVYEKENGFGLSADRILGNRYKMHQHQNNFYNDVSKNYGLERGEIRNDVTRCVHRCTEELRRDTLEAENKRLEEKAQKTQSWIDNVEKGLRQAESLPDFPLAHVKKYLRSKGLEHEYEEWSKGLFNRFREIDFDAR